MPFDRTKVPELLKTAVRNGNLVLLVGSGISRQASDALPTWRTLITDMAENAFSKGMIKRAEQGHIKSLVKQHDFLMAAEALRSKYPLDEYFSFLREKFKTPEAGPAPIHGALFSLKPTLIMTTNYDTLIEDAFAAKFRRNAVSWTPNNAPDVANYLHTASRPNAPPIFKLHGSIENMPSVILTETDYRGLIYRQPGYRLVVSAILATKVVLMLGFSGDDPELRLFFEGVREALQHRAEPDYIFLPKEHLNATEKKRWREDFGIEAIEYVPSAGHPELVEFVEYLAGFVRDTGPAPLGDL